MNIKLDNVSNTRRDIPLYFSKEQKILTENNLIGTSRQQRLVQRKNTFKIITYIQDKIKQIKSEADNGEPVSIAMLNLYNEVINNPGLNKAEKYEKVMHWYLNDFQQFQAD